MTTRSAVVLPLLLTSLVFVAVLRSGTPVPLWRSARPIEAASPTRCTWSCHNHGCDHPSRLPPVLSEGIFNWTVLALHRMGDRISPRDHFAGYRAANLLVFCVVWPVGMLALYVIAIRQRRALRRLRAGERA